MLSCGLQLQDDRSAKEDIADARRLQLQDDRSAKEDTADACELQLRDSRSAKEDVAVRADSSSEMIGAPGGYR